MADEGFSTRPRQQLVFHHARESHWATHDPKEQIIKVDAVVGLQLCERHRLLKKEPDDEYMILKRKKVLKMTDDELKSSLN